MCVLKNLGRQVQIGLAMGCGEHGNVP